ncbi:MAG TPA: ORF6N domain-containing protein [Pyrinomonadaceae bacterium]|nr:ORF6N domain-containing protein [Pyrinomonadaceae bacterium]
MATKQPTKDSDALQIKESVERQIITVRGCRVMLDRDLATLYGVTTKRLNEQVKRNRDRFPEDFMFRLTVAEGKEAIASRSQIATLRPDDEQFKTVFAALLASRPTSPRRQIGFRSASKKK